MTRWHLITQKENGNGEKVIYFALNHIMLTRKCFFTSAYFSPFDLKGSLNQKLSSLKKQMFVLQFFKILLGYNFPRKGKECDKNI